MHRKNPRLMQVAWRWVPAIALVLAPCLGRSEPPETRRIATPDGPIVLHAQPVPSSPQKIVPLDAGRLATLRASSAAAQRFLAAYLPGARPTLVNVDAAFKRWQAEQTRRFSEAQVIAMRGARLGNTLASDYDMEWVEVTKGRGQKGGVRSGKWTFLNFFAR